MSVEVVRGRELEDLRKPSRPISQCQFVPVWRKGLSPGFSSIKILLDSTE